MLVTAGCSSPSVASGHYLRGLEGKEGRKEDGEKKLITVGSESLTDFFTKCSEESSWMLMEKLIRKTNPYKYAHSPAVKSY